MYPVIPFLIGVAVTAALAVAVVSYLKPSLHGVLVDLCGTATRAAFWTAFSTVTVALTPIMFALHYRPDLSAESHAVFEISKQLELALAGLLLSVVLLAVVLAKFIPPREPLRNA
jgi:hypothetical protein